MPEPREAFADLERRIREASMYLDPVNRHRGAYLRGEISVEELEDRIGAELGLAAFEQAPVVPLRAVEERETG